MRIVWEAVARPAFYPYPWMRPFELAGDDARQHAFISQFARMRIRPLGMYILADPRFVKATTNNAVIAPLLPVMQATARAVHHAFALAA